MWAYGRKYDVFISFKNTDPKGGLTVDRTIAQRLHDKLLNEGLNVFFSEKDLSDTAFDNYKSLTVYAPHPASYYNSDYIGGYKDWGVQ